MSFLDSLTTALETVLDWDLPDETCAEAMVVQACLLAGVEPDQIPTTSTRNVECES